MSFIPYADPAAAAATVPASGVYWVGQDGNYYVKTAGVTGVQNAGKSLVPYASNSLTQIADPNAPATAPSSPNGGGAAPPDKSNDIAIQNAGLSAADTQQTSGLSAVDKALAGLTGQYDTESKTNHATYGTQSDTNRNNLETNKESALVNAAQGRRGLFGTLASLGALSGSGIDLANNAVRAGANEDLTGAEGTFGQNQTNLDSSIHAFEQQDAQRRKDAASAADNAKLKVQHDTAVSKQGFLSNLANDYAAEGDAGNAAKYTGMVSDLYPTVAANAAPDTANLSAENAAFTPGTLGNYLAGQDSTVVNTSPTGGTNPGGGNLPGLTASNPNDKKKLLTPALTTA